MLRQHRTRFIDEAGYIRRAIMFVEQHEDIFYRELWPAHVTGSAWVVSPDRESVLMLHHRKLDQWFQPGGHADGDAENERAVGDTSFEFLGFDPFFVHVVWKEVACLPSMQHNVRFGDRTAECLPAFSNFVILKVNCLNHILIPLPL